MDYALNHVGRAGRASLGRVCFKPVITGPFNGVWLRHLRDAGQLREFTLDLGRIAEIPYWDDLNTLRSMRYVNALRPTRYVNAPPPTPSNIPKRITRANIGGVIDWEGFEHIKAAVEGILRSSIPLDHRESLSRCQTSAIQRTD